MRKVYNALGSAGGARGIEQIPGLVRVPIRMRRQVGHGGVQVVVIMMFVRLQALRWVKGDPLQMAELTGKADCGVAEFAAVDQNPGLAVSQQYLQFRQGQAPV